MSGRLTDGLSVVVPSYNSGRWLRETLTAVDRAIQVAGVAPAEIVLVDDGSTDETGDVLDQLSLTLRTPLRRIRTENQGRFLARWSGVTQARYAETMLIDSRVVIDEGALQHVGRVRAGGEGHGPWNAHADTASDAGLVGLFWEVPTYVFWGEYRSDPRPMLITPENFDRVPKGTTCFLVPTALYVAACRACWPTENANLVSDDTMLLRYIASKAPIRLDPGFRVLYRPRQSIPAFLRHSFTRGTLFVSSYGGTSRVRDAALIGLCAAPPLLLAALVSAAVTGHLAPVAFAAVVALLVAAGAPAGLAALRHCPRRGIASFLTFLAPFGAVFWAGLCRGMVVHRAQLLGRARRNDTVAA